MPLSSDVADDSEAMLAVRLLKLVVRDHMPEAIMRKATGTPF